MIFQETRAEGTFRDRSMNPDYTATIAEPTGAPSKDGWPVAFGACEFFRAFFQRLEERKIPYVVLPSYDDFPSHFATDVDCAVREVDLSKTGPLLSEVAREHGW